uniref:Mannitol 2-dehydrogenase n=1 Tax=Tetraselmis chuii TaxID=63592 RepID=A0A7S1SM07_9CHLO|mmetsp:Transcript_1793/g.3134  ORF Transcript_1793/g.3134 Transcript_1793/m.3134 type:complete len:544 (+) Transcript_1793:276-1907(+)
MACPVNQVKASADVSVPAYDSKDLSTGIVHFGIGNFTRAHQMSYLEDLLTIDFEGAKGWAYTGAGVREASGKRHLEQYGSQGYRYSIVQSNGSGSKQRVQVVGAMHEMLVGPLTPGELLKRLSSTETRIVSMTITEFGYTIPFSSQDEELLKLARREGLSTEGDDSFEEADKHNKKYDGATVMGYVIAGLAARRTMGRGGMTILSCDNIPENGNYVHGKIMEKLDSIDRSLKEWVEKNCSFPNCMVDSITPGTDAKVKSNLEKRFGIIDKSPVPREFFKQWVIEDKFVAGRPAWEKVGAQMVKDVHPYEIAKIRMLNVSHTVMSLPGILKNLENGPDAANDLTISHLYRSVIEQEIRPVLKKVPGMSAVNLPKYQKQLEHRFTKGLPDALTRIAQDTSEKLRVQGVPAIREGYEAGLDMKGLAFTVAAWGHYIELAAKDKKKLEDLRGDAVMNAMTTGGIDGLLDNKEIFQELTSDSRWRESVKSSYNGILNKGLDVTIQSLYPKKESFWRGRSVALAAGICVAGVAAGVALQVFGRRVAVSA